MRTAYDSLWDRLSARYRDKPGVIGFEFFNEPDNGSAPLHDWEANTLTPFFSQMGNQLRQSAPRSLFFFDAPGVEAALQSTNLSKPDGANWVFAPHYYQAISALQTGDGDPDQVLGGIQNWQQYSQRWNVPLFVGEFGASHDSATGADFLAAHYAAFDQLGVSGTEWEYSVAAEDWNGEHFGMAHPDGTPYPMAAAIARPYARAIAGTGVQASYDAMKKTWTLAFTGDGNVSEVSLPSAGFPSGADVELTSGCVDDTHPGVLLVQSSAPATLTVKPR